MTTAFLSIFSLLGALLPLLAVFISFPTTASATAVPVFAILSQPLHDDDLDATTTTTTTGQRNSHRNWTTTTTTTTHMYYVAASYVKWLEMAGARAVALPYDASNDTVAELLLQVDGVLLPGGGATLPPSVRAMWRLLHDEYYAKGDFLPLWGTCLGFEFLIELVAEDLNPDFPAPFLQSGFNATNVSLPLLEVEQQHLFRDDDIHAIVTRKNVTMNNHEIGISPSRFMELGLDERFVISSTNIDMSGRPFVSTVESRNPQIWPVYGVQWHPEKNTFEYAMYPNTNIPYEAIDHSPEGIEVSLSLARFLVDLARQNMHRTNRTSSRYTCYSRFPLLNTYPQQAGIKFESVYLLPPINDAGQSTPIVQQQTQHHGLRQIPPAAKNE